MSFATFDLDSTTCDTTHRHAMIDRVNGTDWAAYSKACVDDAPILATVTLIKVLKASDIKIVYLTGREEVSRPETLEWFDRQLLPCDGLYMDPGEAFHMGPYSHSAYKLRRMLDILDDPQWENEQHLFHVDDWPDVKFEFEAAGIPCLCVRTPEEISAFMAEKQEGPR